MSKVDYDALHSRLYQIRTVLPTDFAAHGGTVDRDEESDCGCGCRHAIPLRGQLGADWVLCANADGPRFGMVTFEHQAGAGCFEGKKR